MAKSDLKTKKRMLWIVIALLCSLVLLVGRVAFLQLVRGKELRTAAFEQQTRDSLINANRGDITDRNGKILAQSATAETVSLVPREMEAGDPERVAKALSEILGMDYDEILEKANQKNRYYVVVKRRVDQDIADKIREADLPGVNLDEDSKRYYPYDSFASHVIGFTGTDGQGLAGIEAVFDGVLQGKQGRVEAAKSAQGLDMPYTYEKYIAPEDGQNVVLTIDETIQHFAEKYLQEAYEENQLGNGGACIVMDPNNGEILALSVAPEFDLNDPMTLLPEFEVDTTEMSEEEASAAKSNALQKMWRNKAVSDSYEPGSTFKIMTSSMGFEEGVIKLTDTFTCTGVRHVGGHDIHCWNTRGHGTETFTQAIENSCNPAFMEIGARVGTQNFVKYFQSFGFTATTGVELPGEASGVFFQPNEFSEVNLATSSFGQSFEVTPMQMITAISAAINGGDLFWPHIVKAYTDADGNVTRSFEPEIKRQVVSETTSQNMRTVLESVVSSGTAKNAYIKGYRVGGKTGTSEKLPRGSGLRIASFVGFAPADNPKVICLVMLDEPGGPQKGGGAIAAPVVGSILRDVLKYMGVEPQFSQEELLRMDISTPNVTDMSVASAQKNLTDLGFSVSVRGNGARVTDQVPRGGTRMSGDSTIILYTEGEAETQEITVPDLSGMTAVECNKKLTECGLNLKLSDIATLDGPGTVVAVGQTPAAGSRARYGTVVSVEFRDVSDND